LPERADHLHRLLEHLEAFVGLRPAVAEDVLVERLAAAQAERDAPFQQHRGVAAAWATIAGCMRIVGHVTAVVSFIREVA
jgi:predicted kinase